MSRRITVGIKHMTKEEFNGYHRRKQRYYRELARAERKNKPPTQRRPDNKTCKDCGLSFPYTNEHFYLNAQGYSVARCRECAKTHQRGRAAARSHGLSLEEYFARFKDKTCAICFEPERSKLVLDHCHTSKRIRGVLCHKCNTFLGLAEDNIDILQAAIEYLK